MLGHRTARCERVLQSLASSLLPGLGDSEVSGMLCVDLQDISATSLDYVVTGFEKRTLFSDDMVRIGQKAMES